MKIKLIHVIPLTALKISEATEIAILDSAILMRIYTKDGFNYASYYSIISVNF